MTGVKKNFLKLTLDKSHFITGDSTDVALIKRAKYEINMDVGCMIDGEWIDSLQCNDADGQRKDIIKHFVEYYRYYLSEE